VTGEAVPGAEDVKQPGIAQERQSRLVAGNSDPVIQAAPLHYFLLFEFLDTENQVPPFC
jgi:hypothetical protein